MSRAGEPLFTCFSVLKRNLCTCYAVVPTPRSLSLVSVGPRRLLLAKSQAGFKWWTRLSSQVLEVAPEVENEVQEDIGATWVAQACNGTSSFVRITSANANFRRSVYSRQRRSVGISGARGCTGRAKPAQRCSWRSAVIQFFLACVGGLCTCRDGRSITISGIARAGHGARGGGGRTEHSRVAAEPLRNGANGMGTNGGE